MTEPTKESMERARRWTEEMFTAGDGVRVDRLVLTTRTPPHDHGGWASGPFSDRVAAEFDAVQQEAEARIESALAVIDRVQDRRDLTPALLEEIEKALRGEEGKKEVTSEQ